MHSFPSCRHAWILSQFIREGYEASPGPHVRAGEHGETRIHFYPCHFVPFVEDEFYDLREPLHPRETRKQPRTSPL
jgi:hypothetical protein